MTHFVTFLANTVGNKSGVWQWLCLIVSVVSEQYCKHSVSTPLQLMTVHVVSRTSALNSRH